MLAGLNIPDYDKGVPLAHKPQQDILTIVRDAISGKRNEQSIRLPLRLC